MIQKHEEELSRYQGSHLQSTTDPLGHRGRIISMGVVDEHMFTRECTISSLRDSGDGLDIQSFATCEECLQSSRDLDLILYSAHHVEHNDNNGAPLAPIAKLLHVAPVIILSELDAPELILEAFESGVRGYIPTESTTVELAIEIIRLVRAGGTFIPASSLSLQTINRKGLGPTTTTNQQFTPRQTAVLNHLKLGKANKVIAHELAMSESTVKVHIRNIMKKMKATNRTEVACRAHADVISALRVTVPRT